jgi:peroxiredoxin
MKRLLAGVSLFAGLLLAGEFQLGSKVGDFTLQDVNGKAVPFSSLKGDVTVITFVATQCPVSNAYNERMISLYKDYSSKGVNFVFVNSNGTEPGSEVAEHTRSNNFPFQVHKDENNVVADKFGATVTPEVFILDKAGKIVYHGSIDDSQEISRVKTKRARAALDEVLEGKPVQTAETKAFGCTIKRTKKAS